jgi:flavin-binding protein dodecin
MISPTRNFKQTIFFVFFAGFALCAPMLAQDVLGGITGTVKDATGAAVPDATVRAQNIGTNLEVVQHTQTNGSYTVQNVPAGAYRVTFTKEGFETETHTQVLVNANRITTVDGDLKVGTVATTVEVTATPLMNQVDTTNGYVVDQLTIEETPLGTGSFTQLAILSPGVHADMLGGAGSNSGLGNQAIFANGNRDTSNSFSLNGVDTNNLFNGNSTSQVGENRFVLNIGENFGAGGAIQTSTSVYGAIGQALPTPPVETIQEVSVNTAMYDATQGAHSGAHISVVTKSGTNDLHGMLYEDFQNSVMNAAPFFYNASPAITTKDPFLARNQFGVNLGGPIKKNKLFYFAAYQGVRIADAADATKDVSVPIGLTDDRSLQGIVNAVQTSYGKTITTSQVSPVAAANVAGQTAQRAVPVPQCPDHESELDARL